MLMLVINNSDKTNPNVYSYDYSSKRKMAKKIAI